MKGKSPDQNQRNMFLPILKDIVNPNHELVILADQIDWQSFENEFSPLYSHTGQPGMPIRMMVGLLLLKRIYNLGDETVMEQWLQNPYYQYFCGESVFQWKYPCDPSDLVHFRKRIGEQGAEKIFQLSVDTRKDEIRTKDVIVDSTAQEKNITYPTDAKLLRKVIKQCNRIANEENITQRQSYKQTVKKLMLIQRFAHHPKRKKKANAALRKLRTIAGRLVRELERELSETALNTYAESLENFNRVITQSRHDKNKIYSLNEPEVACIAKGKAHKKFEFGSKVSFAMVPGANLIVGVKTFMGNPNDSITLEPTLKHVDKICSKKFKNVIVDRGYKVKGEINGITVVTPKPPNAKQPYSKSTMRKKCRKRAAIEPIIGHVKQYCRMQRNYLKGFEGDKMNALLAAAGFNFRGLLNKIKEEILWPFIFLTRINLKTQLIPINSIGFWVHKD
jgi:IS5 family transposase